MSMDILDKESEGQHILSPEVGSNTPRTTQSTQFSHAQDDETGFYKDMSFNNKQELDIALNLHFFRRKGITSNAQPIKVYGKP